MMDEPDPAYRAALAGRYEVVMARDFQELDALVSAAGGEPDNYLLFEVEKAVARHAGVRIGTLPEVDGEPWDATLVAPWRARAWGALGVVRALAGERLWTGALGARRALGRRGRWDG